MIDDFYGDDWNSINAKIKSLTYLYKGKAHF